MFKNLLFICVALLVCSCENNPKRRVSHLTDTTLDSSAVLSAIPTLTNTRAITKTWIDDFKEFRQALSANDRVKLKTFFSFPITDDASSMWYLCQLNDEAKIKRDQSVDNPNYFYEQDFDTYYKSIFDQKFLKALLKIRSAELHRKGATETQQFADLNHPYVMYANLDQQLQVLQFNMAFYNNPDENGVSHSEGEHNYIYLFDVVDGVKLRFKRIVFAG